MTMQVCSARRRASSAPSWERAICSASRTAPAWPPGCRPARAQPSLHHRDPGGPSGEADGEQDEQAEQMTEGGRMALELGQCRFENRLGVLGHVHEDERENPHGEHRERHPQAVVGPLDPPQGQAYIDRESRDCTKRDGLCEAHVVPSSATC
jgi:hypothetical protein